MFLTVSLHVPPLEGFWWQDGVQGIDYARKEDFQWISVIRLPDFVTADDFAWVVEEATRKKKTDFSKTEFFTYDEGLCVQCMQVLMTMNPRQLPGCMNTWSPGDMCWT